LAAAFEELGVAAVTIHGRTREQGFTGHVKLAGIRAVVAAVRRIPVIGNGDVRTLHEAHRMFSETGCAAIAIGRGALLNPWLFGQLHAWTQTGEPRPPASYFDRLDFMTTHLDRLIAWRGDQFGCVQFRKVANWYCKTLRTGKVVQQQLMQLSQRTQFSAIVERLRANGPPPHWQPPSATDAGIAVPTGPIAHW
jgi:tRNA-dihydrouridine synthase